MGGESDKGGVSGDSTLWSSQFLRGLCTNIEGLSSVQEPCGRNCSSILILMKITNSTIYIDTTSWLLIIITVQRLFQTSFCLVKFTTEYQHYFLYMTKRKRRGPSLLL